MRIPKKFKVFASEILIGVDNVKMSNNGVLGECSFIESQITLCNNYKGDVINESVVIDTFYHEKIHIILDAMGEHKLSQNEKFVEIFARLLRQSDETAVYEKEDK